MKDLLVKCEIRGRRNAVCIQGRQRKYLRRAQYGCSQAVFRESARRQADSEIGAKVRNGNRTRAVKLDGSPRPMLFQERFTMTSAKWFGGILLAIAAGLASQLAAQVQTDGPPLVAAAKSVVGHIKVHRTALEGNLEGEAADSDVFVFLSPRYALEKSLRYSHVYALHS